MAEPGHEVPAAVAHDDAAAVKGPGNVGARGGGVVRERGERGADAGVAGGEPDLVLVGHLLGVAAEDGGEVGDVGAEGRRVEVALADGADGQDLVGGRDGGAGADDERVVAGRSSGSRSSRSSSRRSGSRRLFCPALSGPVSRAGSSARSGSVLLGRHVFLWELKWHEIGRVCSACVSASARACAEKSRQRETMSSSKI